MKDRRRRFRSKERDALWIIADGECEQCGITLKPGWHADHIIPHSKGGPTDVINGAALCPTCNLRKGSNMQNSTIQDDPRTVWQREAIQKFFDHPGQDFLAEVCPGAGKTRFALTVARQMRAAQQIDLVVVVVPTTRLKDQWSKAAAGLGLDITARRDLPHDAHGIVMTYAGLLHQVAVCRALTARHRTLVILDEIHHAADEGNGEWGGAVKEAFGRCERRLLLSGTAFRHDGNPIPYVEYDDNGISEAQYSLPYSEAVRDGICRPVRFEMLDGNAQWQRGRDRFDANAVDVDERDAGSFFRALYEPSGDWIFTVLERAHRDLLQLRQERPNAGGLVIAPTIPAGREYTRILKKISGVDVVFVSSEDDDPHHDIERFTRSNAPWIVAVKMVSEGVDIQRLTHLVYASSTMTEMFFRQAVGRIVRMDGSNDDTIATTYVPAYSRLSKYAKRIEGEAETGLRDAENEHRAASDSSGLTGQLEITYSLGSGEAQLDSIIRSGQIYEREYITRIEEIRNSDPRFAPLPVEVLAEFARRLDTNPTVAVNVTTPTAPIVTGDDRRQILKQRIRMLVGHCHRASEREYSHIHSDLNEICGDVMAKATVKTLEKRIEVLQGWLS